MKPLKRTQRPALSKRRALVIVLRRGPGTSMDIALTTGFPLRYVSAVLHRLWVEKRIDRSPGRLWPPSGMGCGAYVYSLKGRALWSTKDERTFVRMVRAGEPMTAIAAALGRTRKAVVSRASIRGLTPRN